MLSVKHYLISPQQAYNILLALYCLNCSTFTSPKCQCMQRRQNSKFKTSKFIMCIMCISFNKVSPVQIIYHETRYTLVKAIDVAHPTDMNFHLNYSAVMKCEDNFEFKVTNYNTLALKYILNLLNSLYNFPFTLSKTSYICLYHEIRCPHAMSKIICGN